VQTGELNGTMSPPWINLAGLQGLFDGVLQTGSVP